MTTFADQPLEEQITQWRAYVRRRQGLHGPDVEEIEGHLRDQLAELIETGLTGDEAFLVAVKRMGSLDALSREFARAHSERLWKQLVMAPEGDAPTQAGHYQLFIVLGFAAAAAVAVKVPALFGHSINPNGNFPLFYARNASLFVFPLLTVYFMWKRASNRVRGLWFAMAFATAAVLANVFPFPSGSETEVLTILHLPIALWLTVGFAYVGNRWFDNSERMNFVRFSGELAIYYVLIALGGFVVTLFTFMMFRAIGMNPDWFVVGWLIPCGAAGAVLIGSWLVEAKQSVIENMAPVLTKIFAPLFTMLLLVFLATMAWTGSPINVKRGVLIGFACCWCWSLGWCFTPPLPGIRRHRPTSSTDCNCCSCSAHSRLMEWRSRRLQPAYPSLVSLPIEWQLWARISFFSSTWRGPRGFMRESSVTGVRSPPWSDGRSLICPCTPFGRH